MQNSSMCDLALSLSPHANGVAGWVCNGQTPATKICHGTRSAWAGVKCSSKESILGISLPSLNLHGTIPSSIGLLSDLTGINFSNNLITGSLPTTLGALSDLQLINVYKNNLSGPLPSSLQVLTNLINFKLSLNDKISGEFPTWIGQLYQLTYFSLWQTKLHGTLPSSVGYLTNIQLFLVESNHLVGTIPTTIGLLTNLQFLYLFNNQFTGTVPSVVGNCTALLDFRVNINSLIGSIPTTIGYLTNVQILAFDTNPLTGTIPSSVGYLTNLEGLGIYETSISGQIPTSIGDLVYLTDIYLYNNQLSGTIPTTIGNMFSLTDILCQGNKLAGTLPTSIVMLNASLVYMDFSGNQIAGTIPNVYGSLTALQTLNLYSNNIVGSIPSSLANLGYLSALAINDNSFSGSIPASFGLLTQLINLDLYDNDLTGTIPSTLGFMTSLQYMGLNNNKLIGTIPSSIGGCLALQYLELASNHLTGTIPTELLSLLSLITFDVSDNSLSGTIPPLRSLHALQVINFHNNQFRGRWDNVFNTSLQTQLTFVDVGDNFFSGELPSGMFNVNLTVFVAGGNCIWGSIPDDVCAASNLKILVLDGLRTAEVCRKMFFPHTDIKTFDYYKVPRGSIPPCIFELSSLQLLHLSGNGLTGSIPADVVISPSLMDMALSHNLLHGDIPKHVMNRPWNNLDLSYNSLSGTLSANLSLSPNATLSANVNRLSGVVPTSLLDLPHIDVLENNIFSCNFDTSRLPKHDGAVLTYSCGSDAFQLAIYIWLIVLGLLALIQGRIVYAALLDPRETFATAKKYFKSAGSGWAALLRKMSALYVLVTILIILMLLPTYGFLSVKDGTHDYEYAWSVSAAFLSGLYPAQAMLVVWLVFLSLFVAIYRRFFYLTESGDVSPLMWCAGEWAIARANRLHGMAIFVVFILLNCCVSIVINGLYVYATKTYKMEVLFLLQCTLGLTKFLWMELYVKRIGTLPLMKSGDATRDGNNVVLWSTLILMFNNILAPCLAEGAVDSNCFREMLVQPAKIKASYSYTVCALYFFDATQVGSSDCTESYVHSSTVVYDPPFLYRYQCSATLVTNYSSVFVYLYLSALLRQPWQMAWKNFKKHFKRSSLYNSTTLALSPLFPELQDDLTFAYYVAELLSSLAVLTTFGAVFPPLGVVLCISMFADQMCTAYMIRQKHKEQRAAGIRVEKSAIRSHALCAYIWLLTPFNAAFYSIFLFDTLADEVGSWRAIWAPLVMVGFPVIAWLCTRFLDSRHRGSAVYIRRPQEDDGGARDVDGGTADAERGHGSDLKLKTDIALDEKQNDTVDQNDCSIELHSASKASKEAFSLSVEDADDHKHGEPNPPFAIASAGVSTQMI